MPTQDNGDFFERVDDLMEDVGYADLTGELEVNQHYALYQHEAMDLNHPRGGGPHFLSGPLLKYYAFYLEQIEKVLLYGGAAEAMAENMEHLGTLLDPAAPIDADPNYFRLRRSANPKVFDDGVKVYDRPPIDPRQPIGAPGS